MMLNSAFKASRFATKQNTGLCNSTLRYFSSHLTKRAAQAQATRLLIRASSSYTGYNDGNSNQSYKNLAILLGGVAGVLGLAALTLDDSAYCKEKEEKSGFVRSGHFRKELPTYTEEQVKEHNKTAATIWVSYKEGVYDITEFIKSHPGGPEKILMAAGSSIEPYWAVYPVHYKHETFGILEKHRIGNLKIDPNKVVEKNANDPFANDPKRHPSLKVLTAKPFNAESPKELSIDSLVTPNSLHFVRNHLPVPEIDVKNFKLEIENVATKQKFTFTLEDLKTKFQVHTIPVTLQCSGNKRSLMSKYEPTQGLEWDVNGISNAEWTGVYLKDVLDYCQINLKDEGIQHIQFEGLDKDPTGAYYGASIPKDKVINPNGDVLLAFKMNGVDLPRDFGYPLRAVVPGVIAARSVKWLNKVILSPAESTSHWQVNDYKILPPSLKDLKQADFSKYRAVQESPVQSAICFPVDGAVIEKDDGTITVKGYAFSGGGNSIDKVLVSIDGGKSWKAADINQAKAPLYRCWSWATWECDLEIPQDKASVELTCVATDSQQNTQPESVKSIWNARGLLNNSWHRININLK